MSRTLSGCGSADFLQASPGSRRASNSFETPDSAAEELELPGNSFESSNSRRHLGSYDSTATAMDRTGGDIAGSTSVTSSHVVRESNDRPAPSPQHLHTAVGGIPEDLERKRRESWGQSNGTGTPTMAGGKNRGGGDGAFWSADVGDEGRAGGPRSSLGSASLASVLCDSPAEVSVGG